MKVSVVIPNFNGAQLLKRNLSKILAAVGEAEVIVVDDASTDDSVKEIKNKILNIKNTYKKLNIKLVENKKNLGFAGAVNKGVAESTGNLILLLNTDVIPEKYFLEPAIKHFQDPKVFAVGCLQENKEGSKVVLRGRGIGNFTKGFLIHQKGEVDKSNTLWVSGGAGIFRRNIWLKLGGLNTLYNPFYWEDIDLSYRALKAGYKLIFENKSKVLHDQSEGAIRTSYSKEFVNTISYRNQILFVWLNITDIAFILNHLIYLPIHFLRALITLDGAFLTGFILAILKLPLVLIKRNKNRKLFTVSDKQILANYAS